MEKLKTVSIDDIQELLDSDNINEITTTTDNGDYIVGITGIDIFRERYIAIAWYGASGKIYTEELIAIDKEAFIKDVKEQFDITITA